MPALRLHNVQDVHDNRIDLLTARQVQQIFGVDRSTVYRMAAQGQLPAVKIGRQWRFPADEIERFSAREAATPPRPAPAPVPVDVADAVAAVAGDLLGLTVVVTDIRGVPLTGLANPCPRLAPGDRDPAVVAQCLAEWRQLAEEVDLEPRFHRGALGFECARAFVRVGSELVGMVVAGGVAPAGDPAPGLHRLSDDGRRAVLAALPRVAATLSRAAIGQPSTVATDDPPRGGPRETTSARRSA